MLRSFGRRFDPARLHRRRAATAKAVAVLRFEEPEKKFTPAHAEDPARLHRRRAAIAKAVAVLRSENKERSLSGRKAGISDGAIIPFRSTDPDKDAPLFSPPAG